MHHILERGDIYFFFRYRVDVEQANDLDDLQRFYLILAPDNEEQVRLFLVGKKRMPEIRRGTAESREREWMMNYATGSYKQIGQGLHPEAYTTETRGRRVQPEAIPAAEGRYAIFFKDDGTQLAYRISRPEQQGTAQEQLGIFPEARYVISVRNPEVDVPGFPQEKPDYPESLRRRFAAERWLAIEHADLLAYEKAQLLLIGAAQSLEGVDIEVSGQPSPFHQAFNLDESAWPTDALERGEFPAARKEAEIVELDDARSKAGKRGGEAAKHAASAAGITIALKGTDFPKAQSGLVQQARQNRASSEVVAVLEELPRRTFQDMADVQRAVGEVR